MFICGTCQNKFSSTEYEQFDFPERVEHPYEYTTSCPVCRSEAKLNPVQLNLFKAWLATSNPREGEALANIREGNKKKDTSLSRFNALTHGLTARVARFFPAREGKYAACETCEYLNNGCGQVSTSCMKRAELFLQYELATENKDPNMLNKLMSDTQAGLMAIQTDMMAEIAQTGVVIHDPVHFNDKETGKVRLAEITNPETGETQILTEVRDHPLLKRLIEFVQKNNQTLADMQMTQRQQEEEKTLKGFIEQDEESREEARKRQQLFEQRQEILFGMGVQSLNEVNPIGKPLVINPREDEDGAS